VEKSRRHNEKQKEKLDGCYWINHMNHVQKIKDNKEIFNNTGKSLCSMRLDYQPNSKWLSFFDS
jgi:hypothetical protein